MRFAEKSAFVNTIGYILRRRLQERTYHQLCIARFQLIYEQIVQVRFGTQQGEQTAWRYSILSCLARL